MDKIIYMAICILVDILQLGTLILIMLTMINMLKSEKRK